LTKFSFLFVSLILILSCHNNLDHSSNLDFSAMDEFWKITTILKNDIEPDEKDWNSLFAEFNRILRNGGYFLFSTEHPFAKFKYRDHPEKEILPENYYKTEYMEIFWDSFKLLVPSYRRPLSVFFDCLNKSGFQVDRLIETQPTEDFKQSDPEDYDKVSRNPTFLCIRARKIL